MQVFYDVMQVLYMYNTCLTSIIHVKYMYIKYYTCKKISSKNTSIIVDMQVLYLYFYLIYMYFTCIFQAYTCIIHV